MIDQFKYMSERMSNSPQTIRGIKSRLKEEEIESGAFYMTLPSFRDSYRLVRRIMERNGQSVYLMLCSLVDSKGAPLEDPDKLGNMSEELMVAIKHCLRKGDSFTRYNPSQFLILLVGTNRENCGLIFNRIEKWFARNINPGRNILNSILPLSLTLKRTAHKWYSRKTEFAGRHSHSKRGRTIWKNYSMRSIYQRPIW